MPLQTEEVTNLISERMTRIGGKRANFMRESQEAEIKSNDKIVIMQSKTDNGTQNIDLILEPDKLDQLSSQVRLTFDEYCQVINEVIEEEEDAWHELRMKDQINISRDGIIKATMLKYAAAEYDLKKEDFTGIDVNFTKRYNNAGQFIGEAVTVSLTAIAMMGARIR